MDQRNGLADRATFARIVSILLWISLWAFGTQAQLQRAQVELATSTPDDRLVFHVRIPRGEEILTASFAQNEVLSSLEVDPVALATTQFVLLDASAEMINLQSAVLNALQRLVREDGPRTGIVIYASETSVLQPTDRSTQIDDFLLDYSPTADEPNCLGLALDELNNFERPLDRSWRVMLVTAADFSQEANCPTTAWATVPAPLSVVAISEMVPTELQAFVDRNGGTILRANLRTVEARVNEIRTRWGEPTYRVQGAIPDGFDASAPATLELTLLNGEVVSLPLVIRPVAVSVQQPTPLPTSAATPTMVATTEPAGEGEPSPVAVADQLALYLIGGALLLVLGAIAFAAALVRLRRPVLRSGDSSESFYSALEEPDDMAETQIRDVASPDQGAASTPDQAPQTLSDTRQMVEPEDDLIITQVLTDERFQRMVENARENSAVIAFLRLEGRGEGDYELTRRGALIGRSLECDIQIKGDIAISRKHAQLTVQEDDTVLISRLSASNPVMVGGVQVANRHLLKSNDVIHLSDETRLVFISNTGDFDDEITQVQTDL